ncbi:lytic murein transglycosylase [Nocardioides sp. Kera G14]|uniref:lytic murein transglycosylase n=1 Tax=Nocardioides sp. Kera G14 TaxID=2884264 RepID=UPI001D125D82|nr:lytic murein transglycosylase [Nocardioides sp. Kera G14]UDY23539.1 lytic murein transglycosylase [Nocardioides sp. Kera G14]
MTPRLLTAVPIGVLAVTGLVQVTHGHDRVLPTAAPTRSASQAPTVTPTPTPVPAPALEVSPAGADPASVWTPRSTAAAKPALTSVAASWSDVPTAAQVAYQRAATVIDSADPNCHLDWSLLAGVGRIESDHGRTQGSTVDGNGLATPGIIGPALTGTAGTILVADTDGGALDGDATYDHAVGPMQFLPSTWATVGVDADGDGQRNPQDLDDAALAAAVYLCSGSEDLSTAAGRKAAVFTYNHSTAYVDQVLASTAAYQGGFETGINIVDVSAVEPARSTTPVVTETVTEPAKKHTPKKHVTALASAVAVVRAVKPTTLPTKPTVGEKPGTTGGSTSPGTEPTTDPSTDPATEPTTEPQQTDPTTDPQPAVATSAELSDLARAAVHRAHPDATDAALDQAVATLVDRLTGSTLDEAKDAIDGLVADLSVDGLEPPKNPVLQDPAPTAEAAQSDESAPAGS